MSEKTPMHRDEVQSKAAEETPNACGYLGKDLVEIYGALAGIRDDFKGVVERFRAVQGMNKTMQEVLKFSMPTELNRVDIDEGLCSYELTDDGYSRALAKVVKASTNVERLALVFELANAMRDGLADLKRKEEKLTERIKLTHAGDGDAEGEEAKPGDAPERSIAIKKRASVRAGMLVLEKRMGELCEKFYKTRKRILDDVAKVSGLYARLFKDEKRGKFAPALVAAMLKYDGDPACGALAMLQDGILKTNKVKI